ncbi:MAG: hypothetical protein KAS99_06105 [Candidatus Omnitrophica bacterium]|nr:hypothetical protein [Candidatus Omnitrophota bacterium]
MKKWLILTLAILISASFSLCREAKAITLGQGNTPNTTTMNAQASEVKSFKKVEGHIVLGGTPNVRAIEGTRVIGGSCVIGGIPNEHVIGGEAFDTVIRPNLIENIDSMPAGMSVTLKEETFIDFDEKIWAGAGSEFEVVEIEDKKSLELIRAVDPYALKGAQFADFTLADERVNLDGNLNPEVSAELIANGPTALDDDAKIWTGTGSVYEVTGVEEDGSISLELTESKNPYALKGAQFGEFTLTDERADLDENLNLPAGTKLEADNDIALDDDEKIWTEAGSVYEVTGVNEDGSINLQLTESKNPYALKGAQFGEFTLTDERADLDENLNLLAGAKLEADSDIALDDDAKIFAGKGSVYEVTEANEDGSINLELTEAKNPYALKGAQFGEFTLTDERADLDENLNLLAGTKLEADSDIALDDDAKIFAGKGSVYEVTGANEDGSINLELTEAKNPYALKGAQFGDDFTLTERVNLDENLNLLAGAKLEINNDIALDDDAKIFAGKGSVYEVTGVNEDGSINLQLTESKNPYALKGAQFGEFTLTDERVNLDGDLNPKVGTELIANGPTALDDDEKIWTEAGSVYEVTGANGDGSINLELTEAKNPYALKGAQFGEFTLTDERADLDENLNLPAGAKLEADNDIALDDDAKIFAGEGSVFEVTGVDENESINLELTEAKNPYALKGAQFGEFTLTDERADLDENLNLLAGAKLEADNDIALDKDIALDHDPKIFAGKGSVFEVTEEGARMITAVNAYALLEAKFGEFTLIDIEVTDANQGRVVRNEVGQIIGVTLDEDLLPPVGSILRGPFISAGRSQESTLTARIIGIDKINKKAIIEEKSCRNEVSEAKYYPSGPTPEPTEIPETEIPPPSTISFSDLSISVGPIGLEIREPEIEGFQQPAIISQGDQQPVIDTRISLEIPEPKLTIDINISLKIPETKLFIDIPISQVRVDRSAIRLTLGSRKKIPPTNIGNQEKPLPRNIGYHGIQQP